jgi:hypothetical protein
MRGLVAEIRKSRFGNWVIDTLLALRSVWWLVRGLVIYMLIVPFLPFPGGSGLGMDLLDRLVSPTINLVYAGGLAALVLLSVQWGRGRWAPFAWLRVLRATISLIAAVATPFVLLVTVDQVRGAMSYVRAAGFESFEPGLSVDGQRVRNIFAYDADGRPIERVQLFDQNGEPLVTVGRAGADDEWDYYFFGGGGPTPVAEREIGRQPVWNIFPLREVPFSSWESDVDPDDATAPVFPFAGVPALPAPLTDPTSSTDAATQLLPQPTASPAP